MNHVVECIKKSNEIVSELQSASGIHFYAKLEGRVLYFYTPYSDAYVGINEEGSIYLYDKVGNYINTLESLNSVYDYIKSNRSEFYNTGDYDDFECLVTTLQNQCLLEVTKEQGHLTAEDDIEITAIPLQVICDTTEYEFDSFSSMLITLQGEAIKRNTLSEVWIVKSDSTRKSGDIMFGNELYSYLITTNYRIDFYDGNNLLLEYFGQFDKSNIEYVLSYMKNNIQVFSKETENIVTKEVLRSVAQSTISYVEKTTRLDGAIIIDSGKDFYLYKFSNSDALFKIYKVDKETCCFDVTLDSDYIFTQEFTSIEQIKEFVNSAYDELNTLVGKFLSKPSNTNYEDEVVDFNESTKFSDVTSDYQISIVNGEITEATLVALLFNDKVVAYRFKTNLGYFDITRKAAIQYGVSGYKIEKAIKLQRYNGMLVTQSEINNKRCIPDVSECEDDCKKLFNALFEM